MMLPTRAFFLSMALFFFKNVEAQPIIVLLGPSSAGKSSLAQALQRELANDIKIISYDHFRLQRLIEEGKKYALLPIDYQESNIFIMFAFLKAAIISRPDFEQKKLFIWFRETLGAIDKLFYQHVLAVSSTKKVLVDGFVVKQEQFDFMQQVLGTKNCFYVFVHISLTKIASRVCSRNSMGCAESYRGINRVLYFYPEQYTAISFEGSGDFLTQEIVNAIVSESASLFQEDGFPCGVSLANFLNQTFGLSDASSTILLQPRWPVDFCVDTSVNSSEVSAQLVCEALKLKDLPL